MQDTSQTRTFTITVSPIPDFGRAEIVLGSPCGSGLDLFESTAWARPGGQAVPHDGRADPRLTTLGSTTRGARARPGHHRDHPRSCVQWLTPRAPSTSSSRSSKPPTAGRDVPAGMVGTLPRPLGHHAVAPTLGRRRPPRAAALLRRMRLPLDRLRARPRAAPALRVEHADVRAVAPRKLLTPAERSTRHRERTQRRRADSDLGSVVSDRRHDRGGVRAEPGRRRPLVDHLLDPRGAATLDLDTLSPELLRRARRIRSRRATRPTRGALVRDELEALVRDARSRDDRRRARPLPRRDRPGWPHDLESDDLRSSTRRRPDDPGRPDEPPDDILRSRRTGSISATLAFIEAADPETGPETPRQSTPCNPGRARRAAAAVRGQRRSTSR